MLFASLFKWDTPRPCKVMRIIDGDTVEVEVTLCCKSIVVKVRLADIDTPELRVPGEHEAAVRSKNRLEELTLGKECMMVGKGTCKYGRLLGRLFDLEGVCVNDVMVAEHLVKMPKPS